MSLKRQKSVLCGQYLKHVKDEWSDTEGGNGMGLVRKRAGAGSGKKDGNLTEGPIGRGLFRFMIPIFLGQLLQQLYNMADAWVVGNFASNDAFAAVSLSSNVNMSVITFFAGIAVGGGVVISKYFGAQDEEKLRCAVHTNFLLGIIFSVFATLIGLFFVPILLGWLNTPDSVMVEARLYFGIYFAGVSTVIMYNICMNIMRAVGDSVHPLYYLIFSSIVNMILDLIFVAGFQWSAAGAAVATVIAQGLSVLLCITMLFSISSVNIFAQSNESEKELYLDETNELSCSTGFDYEDDTIISDIFQNKKLNDDSNRIEL